MEKVFEYIKKEWIVLKTAPFSFIGLAVLCVLSGMGLAGWHYSERISTLEAQSGTKDSEISRYRVALGIDRASRGALIELNNIELRSKALSTAATLHQLCVSFRNRSEQLANDLATSKLSQKDKAARHFALQKEESDEFDSSVRSDASLVEIELRRRLSPEAKASIVGLPPAFKGSDGGYLTLLSIMGGSGMDAAFVCVIGNGIEEMGKLLPGDSK